MKFSELTSARLAAIDRDQTLVIVPIAAVEQHGPHMPTGTDFYLCTAVAEALEQRLPDKVLLTPTVWLGASAHHLRLGSTLNSALDTYIATLCDIATSLLDDDYRRLLFLNGHGGNIDPMRVAVREIQPAYPDALLAAGSYWAVADDFIRETLEGDHKYVGHACEFETSMMLHVRPDLVQRDKIADAGQLIPDVMNGVFLSRDMCQRTRDGYTGRPDLASPQKGAALFRGIVDRLVLLTAQLLKEPLATEYPEFLNLSLPQQKSN
jgi:creatinine amidohydrolase